MDVKLTFLVFIPLLATAASQQSPRFTPSGTQNNQGYVPNAALRPWGTVPPPISNHGNPPSTTLSLFRPFGTVPPPRGSQPQNRPWRPTAPLNPRYPYNSYGHRYSSRRLESQFDNSGSAVSSDQGVTLPPLLLRSGIGSGAGVTLPPPSATRSSADSEPGVTLPPLSWRSSAGSEPGVTLPPLSSRSSAGSKPGVTLPSPLWRSSARSEPGVTLPPPPTTQSSVGSQPGVTLPPLPSTSSSGNEPGVTMPPSFNATEETNSSNHADRNTGSNFMRYG